VTSRLPTGAWLAALSGRIRPAQLRTRVLAGVLAVTLATLAAVGVAAVTALRGYLLTKTDQDLRAVLSDYRPVLAALGHGAATASTPGRSGQPASGGKPAEPGTGPPTPARGAERVVEVRVAVRIPEILDKYGVELKTGTATVIGIVGGAPNLVPRLPPNLTGLTDHRGQTVTSSNGRAPLRLLAASANGGTIIVTTSMESLNATIGRLEVIIAVGTLAAAVLVFVGVRIVVRRGLRPVETMAAAADKLTAGDLTSRVSPDDAASEIGRLGAALNGMLARIDTAVRGREASENAARQFLADASHELRTPLASLRANAELYQQGALADRAQLDEAMRRIASEARRMGTLLDDMLRLARLDQHPRQHHQPVNLTRLTIDCAERARIANPQHTWHARIAQGLVTNGDEEMLRRAIDNLLANVATHTPNGTNATVTAAAGDDGTITIEVSDHGPGVPAHQIQHIFDRFYRTPAQTHRPGSGLGLAIVAAIATAHRGTVRAKPNSPHGLRITLTIPGSDQPHTPPAAADHGSSG